MISLSTVRNLTAFIIAVFMCLTLPFSSSAAQLPLLGGENALLMVGKDQPFLSIQEAVDAAQHGDVILVHPGVYREAVDASKKTLTILGTSRTKCILTYPNGNYLTPPLEMGSGTLMNMTIHATAQEKDRNIFAKAYALHTDYDISANNRLYVKNVDFINDDYQTVGIGLRKNFVLEFENCRFFCNGDNNAFFCHDDPSGNGSDGQRLIVKHCLFKNQGTSPTILLQSQERYASRITCLWQYNVVVNNGEGGLIKMHLAAKSHVGGGWLESSYWTNHPASRGNSLKTLNG